ncbi:MAG: threonine-phosphate decarboxylase CobD [Desulfobacterales bacterium]|nr:threonine-phosphate decarboxylase CobD [Desulfobacterales bacterium]
MPLIDRIRKQAVELTPCIHGARAQEISEKSGKSLAELIDFSVNLNPLGPPKLSRPLASALKNIGNYPDNRYPSFRKAAAASLNVKPENIVPGNGSSELIRLFAEAVIEKGNRVIIPFPTFSEYEFQCRLFGARIESVDYSEIKDRTEKNNVTDKTDITNINNIRYTANITEIKPDGCKAVFLCNPNNPTGRLIRKEDVLKLAEKCTRSETFLFVDEAFIELSDPKESITEFAASNDFVVVLRSLTKTFAVPGLRIGFAVASSEFANILNNIRIPWSLNSVALEVGEHLLKGHKGYIKRTLDLIENERKWLSSRLSAIRGLRPYQSDTNFILVDIRDFFISSAKLTEMMLKQGIIIRDCVSFGLKDHIRVAVRKRQENRKLIKALSNVISEWGRELAEKEIGKALEKGATARSRVDCEYYPCHFEGQDCTFCFCPFYPCEDARTGGKIIQKSTGGTVWSCIGCRLIHDRKIAEKVLEELMKNKKLKDVWKYAMEPAL